MRGPPNPAAHVCGMSTDVGLLGNITGCGRTVTITVTGRPYRMSVPDARTLAHTLHDAGSTTPPWATIRLGLEPGHTISVGPDTARRLAHKLDAAADQACTLTRLPHPDATHVPPRAAA